eukprot:jgi/Tetstr1/458642/TSEL_004346.t1
MDAGDPDPIAAEANGYVGIHQVQRDLYEEGRHDGLPKIPNTRGYLARAYPNESAGAKPIRGKKRGEDILKRARALAMAWHEGILGQHYKNGTTPPRNALCTEVEDVCEVTPVAESVPPPSRGAVRVSGISSRPPKSRVALPLADATNMPGHAIVELQAALTKAGLKSIRHDASAVTAAAKAQRLLMWRRSKQ